MDVVIFERFWAVNSEIIKQVTSSWSIFIQNLPTFWSSMYKLIILEYFESFVGYFWLVLTKLRNEINGTGVFFLSWYYFICNRNSSLLTRTIILYFAVKTWPLYSILSQCILVIDSFYEVIQLRTPSHAYIYIYIYIKKFKIYIKTFKTLLHVSITRSTSGSTKYSMTSLRYNLVVTVVYGFSSVY